MRLFEQISLVKMYDSFPLYIVASVGLQVLGVQGFGCYLQKQKRTSDMKLAKDFAATMEEFRKLQNIAIQREVAYKPVAQQNAQTR